MKTLITILGFAGIFLINVSAKAQIVWKGGTPGAENKWEEPRNWSTQKVPGIFDDVVIPDRSTQGNFYPVIKTEVEAIAQLIIKAGANLKLTENGMLTIDGGQTYNTGLTLVGHLDNQGKIIIVDPGMQAIEIFDTSKNIGTIVIINSQADDEMLVDN